MTENDLVDADWSTECIFPNKLRIVWMPMPGSDIMTPAAGSIYLPISNILQLSIGIFGAPLSAANFRVKHTTTIEYTIAPLYKDVISG